MTYKINGVVLDKNRFMSSSMIKSPGNLWACGYNGFGQLGLSDTNNRSSPVQVGSLTNWSQAACGGYHTAVIKTDGTLWTWGNNSVSLTAGQLGLNDLTNRSSPVQVGALSNWKQVDCGMYYTMAVKTDGTLWGWGRNNSGQLGTSNSSDRNSPVQVGTLTNWSKVSCGTTHSAAIKTDGTLWTWGSNAVGQLGEGGSAVKYSPILASSDSWVQVSCGQSYTMAIKSDGSLWACGYNQNGELGLGGYDNLNRYSLTQVGTTSDWAHVSCGESMTVAIKNNGTLWTWGKSAYPGLTGTSPTPTQFSVDTTYKYAETAGNWMIAIKTDGTLWACGHNSGGQLGLGDVTNRSSLVQVGTLTNWSKISKIKNMHAVLTQVIF